MSDWNLRTAVMLYGMGALVGASATQPPDVVASDAFGNTAMGSQVLEKVRGDASSGAGSFNTAAGSFALFSDKTGDQNTGFGYQALQDTDGDSNAAFGWQALINDTTGSFNTAVGSSALTFNTTGIENVAVGNARSTRTTATATRPPAGGL